MKGVPRSRPLTFKASGSSFKVDADCDLRFGLFCICASTALAAPPAPRLWPHNTNFESGRYICETQFTAAPASRAVPLSEGRPLEVQKPRYERATIVYIGASFVGEQAYRPFRTNERLGRRGGKEEPLLLTALAIAVHTPVGTCP